ncbi:glycerate kinase [soil metagenome]
MKLSDQAQYIFSQTLDYVSPERVIPDSLSWNSESGVLTIQEKTITVQYNQSIYLIGFGKASATMAGAIENILGERITDGIVISPDVYHGRQRFQVFKGSHPLPDVESLSSSLELLDFIKSIPDNALVINLVSGGASSLFCLPTGTLEIEDVHIIYSLLIESGASIHEINTVRKVFSAVKGGQILKWLNKTTLVDLMISDIPDDQIGMIGSGPSIAQTISATQAFQVLKKYNLYQHIPHTARQLLAVEMDAEVRDKDYRTTSDFDRHYSFIISSASKMAEKASQIAKSFGFEVHLDKNPWSGSIQEYEDHLMKQINELPEKSVKYRALINFGEPTVQVTGNGLGGRNQELALRMAIKLRSFDKNICFLSVGTDGIDGPTDAAGAIVTNKTWAEASDADINPEDYLEDNDSYNFFDEAGGHIKSGPTGNNLMDLQITLIE